MNAENLKKEVRRLKIGHIALLCAGIFLAFAILGSVLMAAGGAWFFNRNFRWDGFALVGPGQVFEVDDRAELEMDGVTQIRIHTVSDDALIQSGGTKVVAELKGRCRSATVPIRLDARREGSALVIEVKYPPSSSNSSTRLTVTIPEGFSGSLSVTTTSGELYAENLPFRLAAVKFHSVSGDMLLGAAACGELVAGTTSGDVTARGITGRVQINSTSGDVILEYDSFAETSVTTVSGEVTARIPDDQAFLVDFGSVSGNFQSSHPAMGVSRAEGGFRGGTPGGATPLNVKTISGDLRIAGK